MDLTLTLSQNLVQKPGDFDPILHSLKESRGPGGKATPPSSRDLPIMMPGRKGRSDPWERQLHGALRLKPGYTLAEP
jgi:hypothetical protein